MLAGGALFAGRFEIDRLAGEGGMGLVYRAWDRERSSWVALKVLHADGVNDKDRFDREARLLASLSHPGIVEYVAHGIDGDRMYLAMEWLVGHDLSEHLRRKRLDVLEAVAIVERISEALAVAHEQEVVHRDLKPSNLFLVGGDPARIKILDFGVAKQMASGSVQTKTGAMIGTPGYMAPEQTRGERDITKSADVFALGCVLYHCITGEPPFVADHLMAVLVRILFEEPTPIEDVQPAVSPALAALMRGALAKDPDRRPHDAETLALMLRALLDAGEESPPSPQLKPRSSFAQTEQSLFCVVLASPVAEAGGAAGKAIGFLQELRTLGVAAELLANKTLFVSVPVMGSAIDQATLAARCALEIKQRFPAAAVSMATGRGSMRGSSAVGDAADEAARILAKGDKNAAGVHLDTLSAKLLEGRFAQAPQASGSLLLKEEKGVDANRPLLGKSTACVGREAELGTLQAQVASCIDDAEARVVLVTGPPGIGKSRLRHELLRRVDARDEPVTLLLGRCEPSLANEPYGVFRAAIRGLCGITSDLRIEEQQRRIETRVARRISEEIDRERVAAFLGELCGVPFDEVPILEDARREPKIMGERIHRAVLDWLAGECAAAPVMVIFDDVQWSDPSTIAVLDEVLREQENRALFVLALARPEVHDRFPRLFERHKLLEISLRGLSAKACEKLIKQVLGANVAPNLVERAIAQSTGNALFLEEIIRALSEGRPDHPETVLAMLQARIQTLQPDVRSTLRAASLFGLTAVKGGVARVLGLPKDSTLIGTWLDQLVTAELLQPRPRSRFANEIEYEFRHALVRDATYALLTQDDLATGHVIAAEFLAHAGERDLAVIADHYFRGGDLARAAISYLRAAESSFEQGDHGTTRTLVQRGLACKPEGEIRGELHALASYVAFWGSTDEQLRTWAETALPLVRARSRGQCRALQGAIASAFFKGDAPRAMELVPALFAFEPTEDARGAYIEALYAAAFPLMVISVPLMDQLVSRMVQAVRLVEDDAPVMQRYLFAVRSFAASFRAPAPYTAMREGRRAVSLAREAGDIRQERLIPVTSLEWARLELGDLDGVEARLSELARQIDEQEEATTLNLCRVVHAYTLCESPTPERLARAAQLSEAVVATKTLPFAPMGEGALARVALARGDHELAAELATQAMASFPFIPLALAQVAAVQMKALCALQRPNLAAAIAEQVLALTTHVAALGPCDTEVRLAACESFLTAGNEARARGVLDDAMRGIAQRLEVIVDPDVAAGYETKNRHLQHARALAAKLGVTSDSGRSSSSR
jgi:eukaryotic-like serine/threonine-protein kinase